jgi:hypothetical protein
MSKVNDEKGRKSFDLNFGARIILADADEAPDFVAQETGFADYAEIVAAHGNVMIEFSDLDPLMLLIAKQEKERKEREKKQVTLPSATVSADRRTVRFVQYSTPPCDLAGKKFCATCTGSRSRGHDRRFETTPPRNCKGWCCD